MNYKVVGKFVSQILAVEAAFMLPALIISAACQNLNAVIGCNYIRYCFVAICIM